MAFRYKTDSYKLGHFGMYPDDLEYMFSYFEPRSGSEYDDIVVFGTEYYMTQLQESINAYNYDLKDYARFVVDHGEPYNASGWKALQKDYLDKGTLPIRIKALPEGTIVSPGTMVMSVENTDSRFPWLVGHLETWLSNLWYPMTVATKALWVRKIITPHHELTCDDLSAVNFSYHNFGARGSTGGEAAMIGGMAHLTSFDGTDNFEAVLCASEVYDNSNLVGFSIPATEHSVMCSWGTAREFDCIDNYLEKHKSYPMIACVLDTYDIYEAVNYVTSGECQRKIESNDYPVFVIRPDSGDPVVVLNRILDIMTTNDVKFKTNSKGYKEFLKYRIIWGDGVTPETIDSILRCMAIRGFAANNFAFGSGGDLMQAVTRDTCRFAFKASAVKYKGRDEWTGICKAPVTDMSKSSKSDRLMTIRWKPGWHDYKSSSIQTIKESDFDPSKHINAMLTMFDQMMIKGGHQPFPKLHH